MDFWTLAALLFFCVTVVYSYRSVLRPELHEMSPARKGILAVAGPFAVIYGLLIVPVAPLSRTLEIVRHLQVTPLVITLLLVSGASSAVIVEIIRAMFFRRVTWRDMFHFSVIGVAWVALFLVQSALVIVGRRLICPEMM